MIYIASDHAGFDLKTEINKYLTQKGYEFEDVGPLEYDGGDDYPDYALKLCERVLENEGRGILICGSGQGMSIAANKFSGIYAAVCWNETSAELAKRHINSNVLCFGERFVRLDLAQKMIEIWLETPFLNEKRHARRRTKIKEIEKMF